MPRRERQEQLTPALLEYSFESCPLAELSFCCNYEYLASSQLIRDAVERFKAEETDPLARAIALLFGPDISWMLSRGAWPRPYLSIESALRRPSKGSSSSESKKRRSRYLANLVRPRVYLRDAKEVERVVPLYINPNLSLPELKNAIIELLRADYPHLLPKSSKPQFKDAFADLLRREDPESYAGFAQFKRLFHRRGRGSRTQQDRADLKALSAWRLCKQFGYSAQAAIELLHAHRIDTYQDERSLRRAVARATRKISALEDLLRQCAQGMTA